MPGINLFNRRWNISSDDLFYPALLELVVRTIWFLPQLYYFIKYRSLFECNIEELLLSYYIGFLALMVSILLVQSCIIYISTLGTISDDRPRKKMNIYIYIRIFLTFCEVTLSIMGTTWLLTADWNSCSLLLCFTVLANILFCLIALGFLLIVTFIIFDPISHLPDNEYMRKRHILYERLKTIFCCCYCCLYTANSRSPHYENSYRQISSFLEMLFRGGDLTPSDVLAGTILLSQKERDQFNREAQIHERNKRKNRLSEQSISEIPKWMSINEACYFIRYAVATYSWPYYIYMHNLRGFSHLCCNNKLCCLSTTPIEVSAPTDPLQVDPSLVNDALQNNLLIEATTNSDRHMKAFKFLAKIEENDMIYANFNNELFLVPFCVLIDHFKKCVVITIRGTLSMRDVITDVTAECEFYNFDNLCRQPCHVGIMNTAENIYNKIKNHNLLEKAFKNNPNYQLLITGHSLGAGTAVMLSLKLKNEYPNVKCIAYSPPGHLISKDLADYTKSFVMSVVLGDDIVSRLSVRSIHSLKHDIMRVISNTRLPKYKIYWKYSLSFLSNTKTEDKDFYDNTSSDDEDINCKDDLDNSLNSVTSQNILLAQNQNNSNLIELTDEERCDRSGNLAQSIIPPNSLASAAINAIKNETQRSSLSKYTRLKSKKSSLTPSEDSQDPNSLIIKKEVVKQMKRNVYETYPELLMPGNILYIYRIKTVSSNSRVMSRLCSTVFSCFKICKNKRYEIHYDSRWATQDEFKKIVITNRMLLDHFPNTVTDALTYFSLTDPIRI